VYRDKIIGWEYLLGVPYTIIHKLKN